MFILSNLIFVSLHLFSINIKYLSYILHDDHHPMSSLPVLSVPSLLFPSLNLSPFILFPFRCLHLFLSLPFTSFTSLYLSSLPFPFLFPSPFFFFLLFLAFLFPSLRFTLLQEIETHFSSFSSDLWICSFNWCSNASATRLASLSCSCL